MLQDVTPVLLMTIMLCYGLVPINHDGRLLLMGVESSAMGAVFNLSCLMQECQQGFDHRLTPAASVATGAAKTDWWMPDKDDGVVMTVLHDVTGSILLQKTFNTWNAFTYAQDLTWWVHKLQAGRVVVMVVRRAGTYGLGAALPTLTSLGSLLAPYAPPHALWVWAFVVGGQTLLETVAPNPHSLYNSKTLLYAHAVVPLMPFSKPHKDTSHPLLCDSNAAMGPICDPVKPILMSPVLSRIEKISSQDDKKKVGVVVCAGGRLQYLAHTLTRLMETRKISISMVLVVVGTDHNGLVDSSTLSLLEHFHFHYQVVNISQDVPSINHRLFQFYRAAWTAGIESFPDARYLAFLDEDVEVSHDWLEMLLHYAPALEIDASLWCVSGIGAAHINMYSDPHLMMRGSRQPGWGYLVLTAEARKAVAIWPDTSSVSLLYDNFLYRTVGQERECIYPVLSRSRHYGIGVNTLPDIHHFYFLERPLHNGSSVWLPPMTALTISEYDFWVWSRLSQASPITRNPCAPGFLISPKIYEPKDFVFYFFLDNLKNSLEWTLLAECIGAWPYSTQGMHSGTVELPQAWGGSLWLVGVPASPFESLKPSHIPAWHLTTREEFDQQASFFSSLRSITDQINRTLQVAVTQLFL
ncbi:protein O-linked-mannose beta-1,2-N-acetylglucosaminyltransferase 1-like isoform X2 [Homarus americanus]|uniref:protein O-linked-mannose beta-1,2-N-acetylglucosaminyltransferase 1-like isoform X2 n=1 Tax=Homarus americanus TaxID=6706 RepID=UPI001C471C9E|nr:protein O-linked-mannose beta-1,2-N-acetylglucosaminyltransferase 1-like isoform X2 [Homarus americanus]XP_042205286.1 protein O-linked-mannose beta-1,2-N-acetylglucosaminyltransferase 1-like isoform X2 [Homarus americanus]XP_042205287.1 protein O-linked-mannose beta-1,2-N-acetylglucosaminyltransferase 1-like isoform X2 [Homarus americanus]XP_042205288.1 protein O-linked-mannose beta-1,2-N-acetylglucosaminyltransferase 1-like isoform X2 [Homarus americanus]XP_042205289.1 protein O-linked-man